MSICPRCGGNLIKDAEDVTCLQCGHVVVVVPATIVATEERLLLPKTRRRKPWHDGYRL